MEEIIFQNELLGPKSGMRRTREREYLELVNVCEIDRRHRGTLGVGSHQAAQDVEKLHN